MEFLVRLERILFSKGNEQKELPSLSNIRSENIVLSSSSPTGSLLPVTVEGTTTSCSTTSTITAELGQWNLDIEEFLKTPPPLSVLSKSIEDLRGYKEQLYLVANQVAHGILIQCCYDNDDDEAGGSRWPGDTTTVQPTELLRMASCINKVFSTKQQQQQQQKQQKQQERHFTNEGQLFDYIRAGKNLLLWYIQVFLEWQQQQQKQQEQPEQFVEQDNDNGDNNNPLRILQSPPMLELVLNVLKWSVVPKNVTDQSEMSRARYASLYLFYATYGINPHDRMTQEGMKHLLHLNFPQVALDMLCQIDSVLMAWSLIQNLHNLAVSYPSAAKILLYVQASTPVEDATAPWLADLQSLHNNSTTPASLVNVCTAIALWCVRQQPTPQNQSIGHDANDKRFQLVVEVLNTFYALGIGKQLSLSKILLQHQTSSVSTFDGQTINFGLVALVIELLKLTTTKECLYTEDTTKPTPEASIRQCQLATCSLLMDSDPSFGSYLLEYNHDAFAALLQILQLQVNNVVDEVGVNNSAVASLVPILVVCNKYASASVDTRGQIQNFVFPPEAEIVFQQKIQQQAEDGSSSKVSNIMSPLDAPKGTLRGKLVQLLSWPESYIKRCTAELLWTLCDGNATEYVYRVGMGNALPMLNAKGLASLPGTAL
jgi:hypothetical protein